MAEPMSVRCVGTSDSGQGPDGGPEALYEVNGLLTGRDMLALGTLLLRSEHGTVALQDHAEACRGGELVRVPDV